jgi:hypothetical protein
MVAVPLEQGRASELRVESSELRIPAQPPVLREGGGQLSTLNSSLSTLVIL